MTTKISGTFDVQMTPQPDGQDGGETPGPGRLLLDKRYHGPLDAVSRGQMLAVRTAVEGSAGYVAIETVAGTLEGRDGRFALQHSGTMDRGRPSLALSVIPDSGTDALLGLTGRMAIRIEAGGAHFYDFEYELPPAR